MSVRFFEMFKTIVVALLIETYSYCIAEQRVNSYRFVSRRCTFLSVRCGFSMIRVACLVRLYTMRYDVQRCYAHRYELTRCRHDVQRCNGNVWPELTRTGVIGSDVPWLECPACNALTWVITVTE